MKAFAKLAMVGSVLALAACHSSVDNGGAKVERYEEQAPYAHERTVGAEQNRVVEHKADRVYSSRQVK